MARLPGLPPADQGGAAGLAAHRRTVHTNAGDHRRQITIDFDL